MQPERHVRLFRTWPSWPRGNRRKTRFPTSMGAFCRSKMSRSEMPDILYILDTNVLSSLVKNPGGAVARRIAEGLSFPWQN